MATCGGKKKEIDDTYITSITIKKTTHRSQLKKRNGVFKKDSELSIEKDQQFCEPHTHDRSVGI